MKILAVRSIPLSKETQDAWHSAGVKFLRRERGTNIPPNVADKFTAVINLGNMNLEGADVPLVFNEPDLVRKIHSAYSLRKTLGQHSEFLPSYHTDGPHWHKKPGHNGQGKVFHEQFQEYLCPHLDGDIQRHIDGQEYRIISVGDKIVQAFKKDGDNDSGFDFTWCGVSGISNSGFIPLVKEALQCIDLSAYSILAWDVIHDGTRPWIIEVNTSPGVNEPTAQRIVNQIERML